MYRLCRLDICPFSLLILVMLLRHCQGWTNRSLRRTQGHLLQQRNDKHDDSTSHNVKLTIPTSLDMQQIGAIFYTVFSEDQNVTFLPSVICLDGDLGAGKTAFCQGFIRAATGDWEIPVTSPTYLLSNSYTARKDDSDSELVE